MANRELRISIVVPLPSGLFEEAGVLTKVEPALAALKMSLAEAELDAEVTVDAVQPKPRGAKEEAAPEPAPKPHAVHKAA